MPKQLRIDVDSIEGRLDELSEQITAIEEEEEDPAEVAGETQTTLQEIQDELDRLRERLEPTEGEEPESEGGGGDDSPSPDDP